MLNHKSGFTLIELIMVIILISILSVIAVSKWPSVGINVEGQAQQIANDIRYTQSLSMTKGQRYRFVKVSSSTYQITNFAGTPIILALGSNTVTLGSSITFGTLVNLPNSLIAFDGEGVPYTTSTVPGTALASAANIPITSGTQTKTVVINPITGSVTVQ